MSDTSEKIVKKHLGWIFLISVLAILVQGGCGGETAVDQATRDGVLIIGNTSEPKGLDPHIVSGVLESNIIG